jgi:hypothetical protein
MRRLTYHPPLPDIERENSGSCWTCVGRGATCDKGLPGQYIWISVIGTDQGSHYNLDCSICEEDGFECGGYGVRFAWPFPKKPTLSGGQAAENGIPLSRATGSSSPSLSIPAALDSVVLPPEQKLLCHHFLCKLRQVPIFIYGWLTPCAKKKTAVFSVAALGIDYSENGYRCLVAMAQGNDALLNSILAMGSGHLARLRKQSDDGSPLYYSRALRSLGKSLRDPAKVEQESTLATMLCLAAYDVRYPSHALESRLKSNQLQLFNNESGRWKHHFNGVTSWVESYGVSSELSPFLKTWITLMNSQMTLAHGDCPIPLARNWARNLHSGSVQSHGVIDPLFACTVELPNLMVSTRS